ncbi:MAG: cytidylate kinase-like family protein [Lachnospirales bacterium]
MLKTIITISRETGSGGHSIGKMLADKLNYSFYDKEIVAQVANKTGIDNTTILENGENMSDSTFIDLAAGFIPFSRKNKIPFDEIKKSQDNIILNIAKKGNCVIVGRGADYILKDNPNAFHIFIHANMEHRITRVMARDNETNKAKIKKELLIKDKSRNAYYRYFTDRYWGIVSNYNLTLDTSIFTEEQCCQIIIDALEKIGGKNNA